MPRSAARRGAAPLRALGQALEHGGAPPRGFGVVDRGGGVQDPRRLDRLLARPDDRRQLADERGPRLGRCRQQARAVAQHRVDERGRLGGPGAEGRPAASRNRRGGAKSERAARGRGVRRRQRTERAEDDEAHARIRLVDHRDEAAGQRSRRAEARLGEGDRVLAHARHGVLQRGGEGRVVERAEALERPQRVNPRQRRRRLRRHRSQRADGLARLPIDEQALRRASPPEVGTLQRTSPGRRRSRPPSRRRRGRAPARRPDDAVDPPAIAPFGNSARDPSAIRSTVHSGCSMRGR